MLRYSLTITLTILLFIQSCQNRKESFADAGFYDESTGKSADARGLVTEAAASVAEQPSQTIPVETKIIKQASVRIQVKNLNESYRDITRVLKEHQAYYANDNQQTGSNEITRDVVIRVPAKNFDLLLSQISGQAVYTDYQNVTAEDVTEQFVDMEARLKTKREVESRYRALLKEAKKVQDILDIEEKLRVLREEIEAVEGRLKYLNDRVALSTINLQMYEKLPFTPQPQIGFISRLGESLVQGWRGMVTFIVELVSMWPLLAVLSAGIWLLARWRKQRKAQS